jgi:hypothetical protein
MLRQKKINRCTVGVETLESRRLFAVAIGMPAADTLTFTGNFQDDKVYINDNGNGVLSGAVSNAAGVMVAFGPVAGIRRLLINTGDGNDAVNVRITGHMWAGGPHEIQCNLGSGNDWYRYDAISTPTGTVNVGFNDTPTQRVLGGKGDDNLYYLHRGDIDGKVAVTLDGGTENDVLYTDVKCMPSSMGQLSAFSHAGAGKDKVSLLVRKSVAADPIVINAHATSGFDADWDELTRTALCSDDGLFSAVAVVP